MSFLNPREYDVNPQQLPKGLLRISAVWILFLSFLFFILLFKFPIQESLDGHVQIFHKGVPLAIKAKTNAQLNIYVKDREKVDSNERIGFYDWNVSKKDVDILDKIARYNYDTDDVAASTKLNALITSLYSKDISYVQGEIAGITAALNLFNSAVEHNGFSGFEKAQRRRITGIKKNKFANQNVLNHMQEQLAILEDHMAADKILLDKGILSKREYQLKKREYEKEVIEIEAGALSIGTMNDNIQGIESSIELGKYNLVLIQLDNFKNLLSTLEAFKKTYYKIKEEKEILAPIAGETYISDVLRFTKVVQTGDEILTIKPNEISGQSLARIVTGPESIGRVKIGDRVMISLDAFPMEQYGVLFAKIKTIRDISQSDRFIFDLVLPDGLKTSYHKNIKPLAELTGQGNILINRTNIFQVLQEQIMATKTRIKGAQNVD
ncbi:MAG: hypothetical protein V3V00_08510 [Saprospiraceae bacterium]